MELTFLIILVAGALAFRFINTSKHNTRLEAFARRHKLYFEPGGWFQRMRISGSFRGADINVHEERRKSGKHSVTYSIFQAELGSTVPRDLVMFHEGIMSRMGKALGREDIQVGHDELDKSFIIRGVPEDEARALLLAPGVAETLLRLYGVSNTTRVEKGKLTFEVKASMGDGRFAIFLDRLAECAQVLEGKYSDPKQVPRAEVVAGGPPPLPRKLATEADVEALFPKIVAQPPHPDLLYRPYISPDTNAPRESPAPQHGERAHDGAEDTTGYW